MHIITRQGLANKAAERWKATYFSEQSQWKLYSALSDKEAIYNDLIALGPTPKPDYVDLVIGNTSWTHLKCDECESSVDTVIQLGEEPDYESSTANVCYDCIIRADEILTEHHLAAVK